MQQLSNSAGCPDPNRFYSFEEEGVENSKVMDKEEGLILGVIMGGLVAIFLGSMIASSYDNNLRREMMINCVQNDMQWIEGDCVKDD